MVLAAEMVLAVAMAATETEAALVRNAHTHRTQHKPLEAHHRLPT